MRLERNQVIVITISCDNAKDIIGSCITLKQFDLDHEVREFAKAKELKSENGAYLNTYHGRYDSDFVDHLINENLIKEIGVVINIGTYNHLYLD